MTETLAIRRVLVALDASPPSLHALERGVELAVTLEAELAGIFVEDLNLLRLAGLPFASEVGPLGVRRALGDEEMRRALRAQAARARSALVASADPRRLRWSFRIERGPVGPTLGAAALATDLMALGVGRRAASAVLVHLARAVLTCVAGPVLFLPGGETARPSVLVWYEASAAGGRALELGAQLARDGKARLLVAHAPGTAEPDAELRARLPVAVTPVGDVAAPSDLGRIARAESIGMLILPRESVPEAEDLEAMLRAAGCAVLRLP